MYITPLFVNFSSLCYETCISWHQFWMCPTCCLVSWSRIIADHTQCNHISSWRLSIVTFPKARAVVKLRTYVLQPNGLIFTNRVWPAAYLARGIYCPEPGYFLQDQGLDTTSWRVAHVIPASLTADKAYVLPSYHISVITENRFINKGPEKRLV